VCLGDQVRISGLKNYPEMNGLLGVVVNRRDERWQVLISPLGVEKLLREKHLEKIRDTSSDDSSGFGRLEDGVSTYSVKGVSTKQERSEPHLRQRGVQYHIVGSWNKWVPILMNLDPDRMCFQYIVHFGAPAVSFHIVDGEQRCISPGDGARSTDTSSKEGGKNWTIQSQLEDRSTRARFEIRFFPEERRVDWVSMNPARQKGVHQNPTASTSSRHDLARPQRPGRGIVQSRSTEPALGTFIQKSCPQWQEEDLSKVLARLGQVDISCTSDLVTGLSCTGNFHVNRQLALVGEEVFSPDALDAMKSQAEALGLVRGSKTRPVKGMPSVRAAPVTRDAQAPSSRETTVQPPALSPLQLAAQRAAAARSSDARSTPIHEQVLAALGEGGQARSQGSLQPLCSLEEESVKGASSDGAGNGSDVSEGRGTEAEDMAATLDPEDDTRDARSRDERRRELRWMVRESAGDRRKLLTIYDECSACDFREEADLTQVALDRIVVLLRRVEVAVDRGDVKAVEKASHAARSAGVPLADIEECAAAVHSSEVRHAAEHEETVQLDQHGFDGRWLSVASGEHMATIVGATLSWADGPNQEITCSGVGKLGLTMFNKPFSAELDASGLLTWSDGDVWMRDVVG